MTSAAPSASRLNVEEDSRVAASLSSPQQQQIIRASRSILVNNEEVDDHQDQNHTNNNNAAAAVEAAAGVANEDDAAPSPRQQQQPDDDDDDDEDEDEDDEDVDVVVAVAADAHNNNAAAVLLAAAGFANEDDAAPPPLLPPVILHRSEDGGGEHYHSSNSNSSNNTGIASEAVIPSLTNNTNGASSVPLPSRPNVDEGPRVVAADGADRSYARIARTVLKNRGFDPDNLNEENNRGVTPMGYFSAKGNVTMIRYLIAHGASGRKADEDGRFPLLTAARFGHLDVMTVLFHEGGAHEDIQKHNQASISPLRMALQKGHFDVAMWLIRNGALSSGGGNGVINDATMRTDLSPTHSTHFKWDYDKRALVLSWAYDAVSVFDDFENGILMGTHPKSSSLPLRKLLPDILGGVAAYVGVPKPQELRILRQLIHLLSLFIDEVPFVKKNNNNENEADGGYYFRDKILSIFEKITVVVVIMFLAFQTLRSFYDPLVDTHLTIMCLIPGWVCWIMMLHDTGFIFFDYFSAKTLSIVVKILLVVAITIGAFVTLSCLFAYQNLRTKHPEANLPLIDTDLVMTLTLSWALLIMVCYGEKYTDCLYDMVVERLL